MKVPYISATRLKMAKDCTLAYQYQYDPTGESERILKAFSMQSMCNKDAMWTLSRFNPGANLPTRPDDIQNTPKLHPLHTHNAFESHK